MTIKSLITKAFKEKTGISIYEDDEFFSGYVIQMEDDFVTMASFVYNAEEKQYTHTVKFKIAMRRITEVYIGEDDNDLPNLEDYSYPDFQHFYYDKEGLYFAETDKQPTKQTPKILS